jgi:hypothetical protein
MNISPEVKEIIGNLMPLVTALVTAVLGYLLGMLLERKRSQRDLRLKFLDEKREAISYALEWVDMLQAAIDRASSLCYAYAIGNIAESDFLDKYPDNHYQLKDPPARLRVSLPGEAYPNGHRIRREIDELKILGMKQDTRSIPGKVQEIEDHIRQLSTYLEREYKSTFNG